MKKSLFSKLLAGVMSLGLISGGRNFVSNNVIVATEPNCEDEDYTENNKSGKDVTSRYSLEFILKNMINPVWGKASIDKGDLSASTILYSLALVYGGLKAGDEINETKPENAKEKTKIIAKNLLTAHLKTSAISTLLWLAHVDTVLEPLGLVAI